jgi:hypothetical protein
MIGLRPGGEPPERTLRDRFDAALLGAGLAIVGTALIELADVGARAHRGSRT